MTTVAEKASWSVSMATADFEEELGETDLSWDFHHTVEELGSSQRRSQTMRQRDAFIRGLRLRSFSLTASSHEKTR